MDVKTLLNEKHMSMYRLAKESGVPKTTVLDICAGRSRLESCSAGTVLRLSRALGCTMEQLLSSENQN